MLVTSFKCEPYLDFPRKVLIKRILDSCSQGLVRCVIVGCCVRRSSSFLQRIYRRRIVDPPCVAFGRRMPHAGRRIRCLPYTETVMCSRRSCHSDHVKHHSRGLASGKELKDNVYRCHCQVKSAKKTPDKLDGRFCSGSPRSQLILQDPDVGRVILPQSRYVGASMYASVNNVEVGRRLRCPT